MFQNKKFRKAWKKFWEPVLGFGLIQWVFAIFMAIPIWFVYFTSIKRITNIETLYKYRNKPAIVVCWHGRSMMLSPIACLGGLKMYVVASNHKDGRMMAKIQRLFGMRAIYGSSHKGGVSVLRKGVRVLNRGGWGVCISPDGPGGPSLRIKDGALYFAKMSGAPIIPICYSTSRAWLQERWDRYLVALPFSKIACNIGNPIFVPKNATPEQFEEIRKKLENFMVEQMRELDREFDVKPSEQDLTASEFKQKKREEKALKKQIKKAK